MKSRSTITAQSSVTIRLMRTLLLFALFSLVGCQAMIYGTASELNDLTLGMTKAEVIHVLGTPVSISVDGDRGEEYLIYKKMRHTISDWPHLYRVTLREGKAVKWGEIPRGGPLINVTNVNEVRQ